jgi:hypothetical protein
MQAETMATITLSRAFKWPRSPEECYGRSLVLTVLLRALVSVIVTVDVSFG